MRPLIDEPWKTEDWYLNQWRAFYRLRMQKLQTVYKVFGGIGLAAVLFGLLPESFKDRHTYFSDTVAMAGGLAWCYLLFVWGSINWQMSAWDCPRCGEPFFARNPFRRRCQECQLKRPRQSDAGSLASI